MLVAPRVFVKLCGLRGGLPRRYAPRNDSVKICNDTLLSLRGRRPWQSMFVAPRGFCKTVWLAKWIAASLRSSQ